MLAQTSQILKKRVENFARNLPPNPHLTFQIIVGNSVVGGGSAPDAQPETRLLALKHAQISAAKLEEFLRNAAPPIITRIFENQVLIDLRTVAETEEAEILRVLAELKE